MGSGLVCPRMGEAVPIANDLIIKGMSDAVIVLDVEDRILEANPAFHDLAGFNGAAVAGAAYGIADETGQQQEADRHDGQQRGGDEPQSGMFGEGVEHRYPFSSSAVSTSTVMWLL